jgi:5'-nucleotidase
MKDKPHILITNDDGIHAEGLRALVGELRELGELSVVAPHMERSASSQALTLRQPICCEQVAEREWAVEGTPTDAMIVALNKLLERKPDLVISGINRGGNMGENVYYSGTVGAAMEATIKAGKRGARSSYRSPSAASRAGAWSSTRMSNRANRRRRSSRPEGKSTSRVTPRLLVFR